MYGNTQRKNTRFGRKKRVYGNSRNTYRKSGRTVSKKTNKQYIQKWPKWQKATPSTDTRLMKFVYTDTDFDMSTESIDSYRYDHKFGGNTMYDPDQSGVGVQPYGYDNWLGSTAFFSTYKVFGSKIKVYLSTSGSAAQLPKINVYIIPSLESTFNYDDPSDLTQIPGCKQVMFAIGHYQSGNNVKISHYATSNKIMSKELGNDEQSAALYNANPNNLWYWHVIVDTSSWAYEASILMDVKIVYYARLSNPNAQNES